MYFWIRFHALVVAVNVSVLIFDSNGGIMVILCGNALSKNGRGSEKQ